MLEGFLGTSCRSKNTIYSLGEGTQVNYLGPNWKRIGTYDKPPPPPLLSWPPSHRCTAGCVCRRGGGKAVAVATVMAAVDLARVRQPVVCGAEDEEAGLTQLAVSQQLAEGHMTTPEHLHQVSREQTTLPRDLNTFRSLRILYHSKQLLQIILNRLYCPLSYSVIMDQSRFEWYHRTTIEPRGNYKPSKTSSR